MPKTLFVLEIGRSAPSPLYEAWAAAPEASDLRHERISSFEDLNDCEVGADDAMLLPWSVAARPEFVVETVCQDPRWSALPLLVALDQLEPAVKEFLKEYSLTYLVNGRDLAKTPVDVLRCLAADEAAQQVKTFPPGRLPQPELRRFFNELANQRFDAATSRLASWHDAVSPADTLFFNGLLLKSAKRFEEAHKVLGLGLKETRQELRLEPRFLHLLGAVAFKRLDRGNARAFLEAAHKVSPLNLRRRVMLAQVYSEIGDCNLALDHYRALLTRVPDYPGVHARMVELTYQIAKAPKDLETLPALLSRVPANKLPSLSKRIKLRTELEMQKTFARALGEAYLTHARGASDADDFYGSLGYLEKAEPLATQAGVKTVALVLAMRVSAALALEDVALADGTLTRLKQVQADAGEIPNLAARLERLKARQKKS